MKTVSVFIPIYRYRFGIDMGDFGDIGICLNILLTDTDISVSVYRYRSNSNNGFQAFPGSPISIYRQYNTEDP